MLSGFCWQPSVPNSIPLREEWCTSRYHQIKSLSCFVLTGKGQQKDKNPEEMNRLRDQLVSTFKEQMDIR